MPDLPAGSATPAAATPSAAPATPMPSGPNPSAGGSVGGSGGGAPPSPAPAAASIPSPSPAPAATGSQPGAGGGTTQEQAGVLDALRQIGLTDFAGQHTNDHAALQALAVAYRQYQQAQPLLPYVQQFAQHAPQFQQWLQQQQQAQQQQAQKPANPFGLPQIDQRLFQQVQRNPQTGQLENLPGAPFDAAQRVAEYAFKLREVQDQFWQNPAQFLGPMIQEAVRQQGGQLVQQGLGGYQEAMAVGQYEQQNAEWIYERVNGVQVRDPLTGAPVFSDWGRKLVTYANQLQQSGVQNKQQALNMAHALVQRDALMARHQAAQAQGTAADAARQQFLQQPGQQTPPGAAHSPNLGGSVQSPSPNGTTPSQNPTASMRERLTKNMRANGFQVASNV